MILAILLGMLIPDHSLILSTDSGFTPGTALLQRTGPGTIFSLRAELGRKNPDFSYLSARIGSDRGVSIIFSGATSNTAHPRCAVSQPSASPIDSFLCDSRGEGTAGCQGQGQGIYAKTLLAREVRLELREPTLNASSPAALSNARRSSISAPTSSHDLCKDGDIPSSVAFVSKQAKDTDRFAPLNL
ncbi:hypothetical protein B0H11DRAFT_2244850 [Mycena galericulata]|nr:hypothetical protein B0H11DRAFT_2244850 [Mycena galericulata]